jgi:hypothetical protein
MYEILIVSVVAPVGLVEPEAMFDVLTGEAYDNMW